MKLYGMPEYATVEQIKPLTAKARGTLGELTVAKALTSYGFTARKLREGDKLGDISASTETQLRTIEVKTAFRGSRGTFQFCLKREQKPGMSRGSTDHNNADFVMLLAVEDDFSVIGFLIPSNVLDLKKIEFADPLACKWRQYLVWQ